MYEASAEMKWFGQTEFSFTSNVENLPKQYVYVETCSNNYISRKTVAKVYQIFIHDRGAFFLSSIYWLMKNCFQNLNVLFSKPCPY